MDLSGDHRFYDNLETITLDYQAAGVDSVSVPKSLRQHVRLQDATGAWVVSSTNLTWFLPGASITTDPKQGDVIQVSASERYTILDATYEQMTKEWECNTVKERT
jgi:hypothetical protein